MGSLSKALRVAVVCPVLAAIAGCACKGDSHANVQQSTIRTSEYGDAMLLSPGEARDGQTAMQIPAAQRSVQIRPTVAPGGAMVLTSDMSNPMNRPPASAVPGECWASVFQPPQLQNVTERICLKEASERYEISPAEFEWVEEQVCTKPASKQYVVAPAKYETVTQTVVVDAGRTDWLPADESRCRQPVGEKAVGGVFCPVNFPKVEKNVSVERLVQPASFREIDVPAEYQTVRYQRIVKPASSRRIEVPAEYETVEKTVEVSPGRWEWQRVSCEGQPTAQSPNNQKTFVRKTGYAPDNAENHQPK